MREKERIYEKISKTSTDEYHFDQYDLLRKIKNSKRMKLSNFLKDYCKKKTSGIK